MSAPLFTVLDLFSGIGGFALATEWVGGRTLAFAEVAEYQSKVLSHHWPAVPNLGDVRSLCRRIVDNLANGEEYDPDWLECTIHPGEDFGDCACIGTDQFADTYGLPDVIAGGVPCQPASLVGKRRGVADERWLWPETLRIIGELQPRYCILENPRALLSLQGGDAFRGILGEFASLGYDVQWDVVPAAALGAGHRRERLWILASHPDCARLEGHARDDKHETAPEWCCGQGRRISAPDLSTRTISGPLWYRESGISPVVNGLSGGVVKDQLTAIGNSLVPQVALVWLSVIADRFRLARGAA